MKTEDDWFLPAIHAEGTVANCLDVVARQEESRLFLTKSIKLALCRESGDCTDSISFLRKKLGALHKTFELRLGVLAQARHQAWFRPSHASEWGPFPGVVHKDPMLIEFNPELAKKLRNELNQAWQDRSVEVPSLPQGNCLWFQLLTLNKQWQSIVQLSKPFGDLRLDELPEGLPDDLTCRSLEAFLKKVRVAVDEARSELDQCFQKLFLATETFLLAYHKRPAKTRRQGAGRKPIFNSPISDSLRFMAFDRKPNAQDLRKRYLELAKSCHPDVNGGSESRFKDLTYHYNKILKSIPR